MVAPLTPTQRRVLDFLREFVERHRFAPTAAEIAGRFGIAVKNGFYYLELLERKGEYFELWSRQQEAREYQEKLSLLEEV